MNNKFIFILLSILFLGTISVIAGNVLVSEDGITSSFFSSKGNPGITQNVSYDNGAKILVIEDGIVVGVEEYVSNSSSGNWWDTDWVYRKSISGLTGNISYVEIAKESSMNSDFSDIRFVFNGSVELNYTLGSYSSTSAQFRVSNLGKGSVEMYYGNAGATDGSSVGDVYFNPVSAYYLDANANDFVGSNDGTVNGTTLTSGYINGSYSFDGINDYINFGEIPVTTAISISVWAYFSDNLANPIISKRTNGNNWQISSTNGNYDAYFLVWTSGGSGEANTGTGDITQNTWHNIVGTYDGSNVRIYLDGVLKDTQPLTGTIMNNSNIIKFGTDSPGGSNYYNGKIDELYVYNKNLTQDQITQLYTQTAPNFIEGSEESQ